MQATALAADGFEFVRWDESACLCEMVSRGSRVLSVHGRPTWTTPAGGGGELAPSAVASVRGPGVAGGDLRSFGLAIARRLIDVAEWARPVIGRGRVRAAAVFSGRTVTARASAWVATGPTAAPPTPGPAAVFRAGGAVVSFAAIPGPAGGPHESDDLAVAAPALPPPPTTLQVVEYYHLDALGSRRQCSPFEDPVAASPPRLLSPSGQGRHRSDDQPMHSTTCYPPCRPGS